jgi:2-dehydrotetronate isomerase
LPKLAANISTLFTELPFLDRIAAAKAAGFKAIECQGPYHTQAADFARTLKSEGIPVVLMNAPMGGERDRGLAALPGRARDFRDSMERALAYAHEIGAPRMHVLAGAIAPDAASEAAYIENIRWASERARAVGVIVQLEPLNAQDNPLYFLRSTAQTVALLARIDRDNVKMQFDFYHCQITEGDLARHAEALLPHYSHIQIAGVPGRNEPDRGEINYPFLFDLLDRIGYDGWVGAEYRPAAGTLAGLGWAKRWGIGGGAP